MPVRRAARGLGRLRIRSLDVEADDEAVAVRRVARLGRLDATAVPVLDDPPLDEERIAGPNGEQPGVLRRGDRGADRAASRGAGRCRPEPRASWSEPVARSAAITPSLEASIRTVDSRAIGWSSARRNRRRWTTGCPVSMPRLAASEAVLGRMTRSSTCELGTRPARRISWVNVISRLARRCAGGSTTKLPRPGFRSIRPSSASRCMALRAVIRLTRNSAQSSASEGSRAPGPREAIRSRSACSIWR